MEGLVTEYDYEAVILRDGGVGKVDTLDELEEIQIDEIGTMEAFTTSGGTSTAPYTFDDNSVGVLGVVGPSRMAYDRVIPIVDVTAKLLSEALKS